MSYTEFLALSKDLQALLIPLLFLMSFFIYKLGGIVLKLHINDKAQDLKLEQLKDNCRVCTA